MPAYFSMILQIKKENKYDDLISDLTDTLISNGFVYDRTDYECGDNSLSDVIKYNNAKLKDDFELGYYEHFSHDFRQIYWKFRDFSEVRQFYLNEKDIDWFGCCIIIPESDIITGAEGGYAFDPRATEALKSIAKALWRLDFVESIQTELELAGDAAELDELERGECPSAFPFAVIRKEFMNEKYRHIFSRITKIDRDGLLLERDDC